jgi:hypothetical protein
VRDRSSLERPLRTTLRVLVASADELAAHAARLASVDRVSGGTCLWQAP